METVVDISSDLLNGSVSAAITVLALVLFGPLIKKVTHWVATHRVVHGSAVRISDTDFESSLSSLWSGCKGDWSGVHVLVNSLLFVLLGAGKIAADYAIVGETRFVDSTFIGNVYVAKATSDFGMGPVTDVRVCFSYNPLGQIEVGLPQLEGDGPALAQEPCYTSNDLVSFTTVENRDVAGNVMYTVSNYSNIVGYTVVGYSADRREAVVGAGSNGKALDLTHLSCRRDGALRAVSIRLEQMSSGGEFLPGRTGFSVEACEGRDCVFVANYTGQGSVNVIEDRAGRGFCDVVISYVGYLSETDPGGQSSPDTAGRDISVTYTVTLLTTLTNSDFVANQASRIHHLLGQTFKPGRGTIVRFRSKPISRVKWRFFIPLGLAALFLGFGGAVAAAALCITAWRAGLKAVKVVDPAWVANQAGGASEDGNCGTGTDIVPRAWQRYYVRSYYDDSRNHLQLVTERRLADFEAPPPERGAKFFGRFGSWARPLRSSAQV